MVFGHQKFSGGYQVLIGSPEGVSGTPGNPVGHIGLVKEHTSPHGAGAPYRAIGGGEGKGKYGLGCPLLSHTPSFLPLQAYMERGVQGKAGPLRGGGQP